MKREHEGTMLSKNARAVQPWLPTRSIPIPCSFSAWKRWIGVGRWTDGSLVATMLVWSFKTKIESFMLEKKKTNSGQQFVLLPIELRRPV